MAKKIEYKKGQSSTPDLDINISTNAITSPHMLHNTVNDSQLNSFKDEIATGAQDTLKEKTNKLRDFRKEVSKLASLANKRLRRLEKNELTDSPAYQSVVRNGEPQFSVKGKSYNELQQELSRLNKFINAQTSTIRGINNNLKDIAKNTGIKYKNVTELREKSAKFFELSSKVEQYLRTVDDMASAIGYQKIWEAINQYTKDNKLDLADSTMTIDLMVENVTNLVKEYEDRDTFGFSVDGVGTSGWFSLSKD